MMERLKSEQKGSDFRHCLKSELFDNGMNDYEKRQNQNIRISDTYCIESGRNIKVWSGVTLISSLTKSFAIEIEKKKFCQVAKKIKVKIKGKKNFF